MLVFIVGPPANRLHATRVKHLLNSYAQIYPHRNSGIGLIGDLIERLMALRERPRERDDVCPKSGHLGLRIGQPIPAGRAWAEHVGQASDTCRTISSPDFPGIYAIVEDGKVRRITAGERSTVKLAENIGVGSTEKEVRDRFPGFRAEPHEYQIAPAKYLTAPNAESGVSALRFEIGDDCKVILIHVGTMPVLGYVEGCA